MNRNLFLRLPVLLLLVGAGLATAQTVTSTLTGKITDSSGAVIAHATVTIRDTSTGKTMTVETGDNGEYLATNLTPATYEITITAPGFRTGDVHNADLLLNATLRNDVSLTVGSANQKIEVSAAPPVISTDTSAVATLIDMKASSQLPLNGRTVDRLILFTAGNTSDSASAPKLGGSMHWGGSYFTVDGGTYNDLGNGQGAYSYATNLTTHALHRSHPGDEGGEQPDQG